MAGMIVTWLQNTEKFCSPSAAARSIVIAVDGAVVSNPIAMNTTCRSGFCRAIFSESSGEYTMRMSVPAAWVEQPWVARVVDFVPAALLAALVAVQGLTSDDRVVVDGRLAGLAVAALALALRAPFIVVIVLAGATGAGVHVLPG